MIKLARYYGTPPWVLAGVPDTADLVCWQTWGHLAMWADGYAQELAEQRARRARGGSGARPGLQRGG